MHEYPIHFTPPLFLGLGFVPSWTFEIQICNEIHNQASADQAGDGWSTQSGGRFDGIKRPRNSVDALIKLTRFHRTKGTERLTSPKIIVVIAASRSLVPTLEYGTTNSTPLLSRIPRQNGMLPDQLDLNMRMWLPNSTSSPTPQKTYLSQAPTEFLPKSV